MNTHLSIQPTQLRALQPDKAVELFRQLLWAEASALGIGKNLINVPSAITVGDGGVDADVQGVTIHGGQGLIKQGFTAYQIKTGDFSPSKESNIKSILFKPGSKQLQPRVKSCLEKGGTFVIVLFGWDGPDKTEGQLVDKFRSKLVEIDPAYASAKIEVWRTNQIIGFLEQYPSLRLKACGLEGLPFQTHDEWSRWEDMSVPLRIGSEQTKYLSDFSTALRRDNEPVQIRVTGEPGIGKTRLVLEATRAHDIAPLTIYCQSPQALWDSGLINHILLHDNVTRAIFVVDECDPDDKVDIWNRLRNASPRIKLVTIHSDPEEKSSNTTYLNSPILANEQIGQIIQGYDIKADKADRWIPYCSGSPRVAHVIGQSLKLDYNLIDSPDIVRVWNRYIAAKDAVGSEAFQKRKNILMWLSMFKRFGFGAPYAEEAQLIAQKIEFEERIYPWREFQRTVRELQKRRILQGQRTLYITPKLFHIWLWTEWWETYGKAEKFDLDRFLCINPDQEPVVRLTAPLVDGFFEMFEYAAGSEASAEFVRELLSPEGPFNFDVLNTDRGSRFFRVLAEGDPPKGLACLKRLLGKRTKAALFELNAGRRAIVWSLEALAVWRELFVDAARLLLALGEAENESWSNNASGVFVALFSPAPERFAPTEASPTERLPVLREALRSSSKERRMLALRASQIALGPGQLVRTIGRERQGLNREPERWKPATWDELFNSYREVWYLVCDSIEKLPNDEKTEGVAVLLHNASNLSRYTELTDMVLNTLEDLAKKPNIDQRQILETAISTVRFHTNLPAEILARWKALKDALTGSDFSSQMKRYVGMDVLADRVDEQGNSVDRTQIPIEQLAQQAVTQPELLEPELSWLTTPEAKNGYRFGYELGKLDTCSNFLPILTRALVQAGKAGASYLLGGYLHAYHESAPDAWEEYMDQLAVNEQTACWVAELTWRTGSLSDRAALRILHLAEEGRIPVEQLGLFTLGSVIRGATESIFQQWIRLLLTRTESRALSAALDLYDFYYVRGEQQKSMPEGLTFDLLTLPGLFGIPKPFPAGTMDTYHWTEIGKRFIELYPGKSVDFAEIMLRSMGNDGAIIDRFHSDSREVLNLITRLHPREIWRLATRYFGPPIDIRAYHIRAWLHDEDMFQQSCSAIELIPHEEIWNWIDEDVHQRAWYAAGIVPKHLFHDENRICIARELLVRYGEREEVRRNFAANYSTEVWSGDASEHFRETRKELQTFKALETNSNVLQWLEEYLTGVEKQIETALAREERAN